jgi:hypothetical protein
MIALGIEVFIIEGNDVLWTEERTEMAALATFLIDNNATFSH